VFEFKHWLACRWFVRPFASQECLHITSNAEEDRLKQLVGQARQEERHGEAATNIGLLEVRS